MRLRPLVGATVVLALLIAIPAALAGKPGHSPNAKLCQKGGWQTLYTRAGTPFGNETQCSSYGAQGGQIINQAALACLNGGWQNLGSSSTTPFTSEQQCVDQAVGGGTLVTFADVRLGSEDSEALSCGPPHDPASCDSIDVRVYNDGPSAVTVTVSLSGTFVEPAANSSAGVLTGNNICSFVNNNGSWTATCTTSVPSGGGNTFLARIFARNGASQVGSAEITASSAADPDASNDTLAWDFTAPVPSSLGDRAWVDSNVNGLQDAGEAGLAGVTFLLRVSATGALVQIAVSNNSGTYRFANVPAGDYYVEVQPPFGWTLTPLDNVGADDTIDSDFDLDNFTTSSFSYSPGLNNLTIDAGLIQDQGT
jgi:hypothetical protein